MRSVAATDLADILKPKTSGETINVHVVESAKEPQPDFESMRRTIEGGTLSKESVVSEREPKS
jgi:hypothetical protein